MKYNPTTVKAVLFVGATVAVHYSYKNWYKPMKLRQNLREAEELADTMYHKENKDSVRF